MTTLELVRDDTRDPEQEVLLADPERLARLDLEGTTALRQAGESEERIATVASWWDAECFTDAERAALALTDAVFEPARRGHERVTDDLFAGVAKYYDDQALAGLVAVVAPAGFWMNIALIVKPPDAA